MYIIPTVRPGVQQARLKICHDCKWYKTKTGSCGTLIVGERVEEEAENKVRHYRRVIRLCGCVMKWKTKYRLSSCPAGKWSAEALSESEIEKLKVFVSEIKGKSKLFHEEVQQLFRWFSKITGQHQAVTNCPPCVKSVMTELEKEINRLK